MTTTLHPVSPAQIQNELNRIWDSLETKKIARACLFNLIFYTQKNYRTGYIQKIAQKVVEKFPSRVIFVSFDKSSNQDALTTSVSILKSSKGDFDVACDYIQIDASGASHERIPFVVLPHILPDLPVYLVWVEDPSLEDSVCYPLQKFANRLIFDSESTDNLPRFAKSILDRKENLQTDIADLNWARIESWREMLSIAFYSDEKLHQIERATQIKIVYNAQETPFFCHNRIQSYYLQAWLACQLDWKFQALKIDKDAAHFTYQGKFGPIAIAVEPAQHAKLPPGLILSVDVMTSEEVHFNFASSLDHLHHITLQCSTPQSCDLPAQYIFSKAESGHSLVKEICHRGTSEHYVKVLNLLKTMEKLGLC